MTEHLAGDFNQDGRVNTADISDMLLALTNPSGYQNLSGLTDPSTLLTIEDVNGDGIFTNADLQAFLILSALRRRFEFCSGTIKRLDRRTILGLRRCKLIRNE